MRPKMTLDRYRDLASRLPRPSHEQIEAYVTYIRRQHSWYKHLPILPPGRPFHFFLDPGAGMTRVVREDGQFALQPRSDAELYHHAWLSTDDTRARFGYLSYKVINPRTVVQDHDVPSVLDPELGIDVHLPGEVLEAARTDVSGLIHPAGSDHHFIVSQLSHRAPVWPSETGGEDVGHKIIARARALVEKRTPLEPAPDDAELDVATRLGLTYLDWTLHQMLASERQRQHVGMMQAALRAVAFAYRS